MDTSLILKINEKFQEVDLYEDIPISLTIQEIDITNFENRKSPFTKTFLVPGTHNNNIVFENYFEVNGTDFNPLVKIDAVVQYRGTDIFNGLARLNAVLIKPTGIEYELYLLSEVADFVSELKDLTLQELDWINLTHSLTYDNLVKSWEAKNNDTDGLFGGQILYPMINYGLIYDNNVPAFTYSFTGARSFSQPGNALIPQNFKPAVRIKTVIDKIFENTTYTIDSEFFNTNYFKSIYMDTFLDGNVGTSSASGVTNQNIFKVYTNREFVLRPNALGFTFLNFQTFRNDGYDPLNNFTLGPTNTTVNQPAPPPQNSSYFRAPFAGTYSFNFQLILSGENNVGADFVAGQLIARKGPSLAALEVGGNFAATVPFFSNAFPTGLPINWFFTTTLNAGDYVKIGWNTSQSNNPGVASVTFKGFNSGGVSTPAPMFELFASPLITGPPLVDLGIGITNMGCIDFFKAIVLMFNLVVIEDEKNKTLKIEPYNWYYNDEDREVKDFTHILDLNSSYRIEPLSFDLSKQLDFTYTSGDEEFLNKRWFDEKTYNYGRYRYVSTGNLLTGEQTYELPFAPVPTENLIDSEYVIIPKFFRDIDEKQLPYTDKPHLFFWVGNRYCYLDKFKTTGSFWYLLSGSTAQLFTTYPCVSHLSTLDITLPRFVSDLNFGTDFDFFFQDNEIPVQVTSFTLFNTWWEDYIDNNYSPESRRLIANFYYTPLDLYETKLNDKIFIKDSNFKIEKINEGDLVNDKLTNIQLIKERGGYYKVIPPSPQYFITSGQTTYPILAPPTGISAYVSTVKNSVCVSLPSTLTTIYQFGFATTLVEGNSVSDNISGIGFTPQGTYVKDAITNEVFVVGNQYGQLIKDPC